MGCFLEDLGAFDINTNQWTTAAQDEGEWRKTAEQGTERSMEKWVTAEKAREACPDVTGRTQKRISQSKQARVGSLAIGD